MNNKKKANRKNENKDNDRKSKEVCFHFIKK